MSWHCIIRRQGGAPIDQGAARELLSGYLNVGDEAMWKDGRLLDVMIAERQALTIRLSKSFISLRTSGPTAPIMELFTFLREQGFLIFDEQRGEYIEG